MRDPASRHTDTAEVSRFPDHLFGVSIADDSAGVLNGGGSDAHLREDEHGVMVYGLCITLPLVRRARQGPRGAGGATRQALRAGRLHSPRRTGG
jgi:hypothetical protein